MRTNRSGRRDLIKQLGLAGAWAAAGAAGAFAAQAPRRPNILLVLADDMGYSDPGCFGGEIQTPTLDRLAAGGLRFTHFHTTARCCPSRAALLTGLYPHQTGIGAMMNDQGVDGYRGDLNRQCVTIAEALKPAGYRSYAAGKWHVTRFLPPDGPRHNWPLQRGFDRYFGIVTGAASYFQPDTLLRDNEPIEPPEDFFFTDAIADNTVEFIRDHHRRYADTPFFSYVSFTAPHWPLHATPADIAAQQGRFNAGWDALREQRYKRMLAMGILDARWKLSPRDARVPAWSDAPDKEWQLRRMEVYAAQMTAMDRGIGRITRELERQGTLDDTLILFLSDNGGCHEELTASWANYLTGGREKVARTTTRSGRPVQFINDPTVMPGPDDTYQSYGLPWSNVSNTPFRLSKSFTHAGGVNTPLIAHWPARIKAAGELRRQSGHMIDLMATCLEVGGATYPANRDGEAVTPLEGKSLVPAFDDRALTREALYFEHGGNRAMISGQYKLVARGGSGPWELYDFHADWTELTDLAAQRPGVVDALAAQWTRWAERTRVLPRPTPGG